MKRFRWDKKYLYWGITAFLVIVCSVAFYLILSQFSVIGAKIGRLFTILSPFIWGLVISYLLCPLTNIYERHVFLPLIAFINKKFRNGREGKHKNTHRGLAVLFSMLTLIILISAFIWLVAPQLIISLQNIVQNSGDYINSVYAWIEKFFADYPELASTLGISIGNISESIFGWIEAIIPELAGFVSNITSGVLTVLKGVYNIIIGMVASVYVLYNRNAFGAYMKKLVYCIFSVEAAEKVIMGVGFADRVFNGFISGRILDSAIIGVICYIGCAILGMPYSMLIAVIVGITNIIPFFGPFIGAIPSIMIIFMVSPVKALIFTIFIIVLQQFDGNFLGPKILGNIVGINGFWIMFSIIVGSGLFGFGGMLLGVPVFVLIYTLITNLVNRKLRRSGLPTDGDVYKNISYIDPKTGEPLQRDPERDRADKKEFRAHKNNYKGNLWKRFMDVKNRHKSAGEEKTTEEPKISENTEE